MQACLIGWFEPSHFFFFMTQSIFSAFHGFLGNPLVLRTVSLESKKTEQLITNWSLGAVKVASPTHTPARSELGAWVREAVGELCGRWQCPERMALGQCQLTLALGTAFGIYMLAPG